MSYADQVFISMCEDILENGTSTEGEKVRPHWPDGESAYTIKQFGVVNRYDLSKEFPALTLRKTYIKSAIDELLWIWQKKSNNVNDLKSHIWDEWADETGSIGKAYGYQIGVKSQYKEGMMDQMDRVLYDLKNNPFSRRIITNTYVHEDLSEMQKKNNLKQQETLKACYFDAPDLQGVGKNGYRFINAVSDMAYHGKPLRQTKNYNENLFRKTIDGLPVLDKTYQMLLSV